MTDQKKDETKPAEPDVEQAPDTAPATQPEPGSETGAKPAEEDTAPAEEPKLEVAYPGSNPHPTDDPGPVEDHSDPVTDEVEAKFPVTPGTESREERAAIAEEQRTKIAAAHGDEDAQDELDEDDADPDPETPADDSPIHGESTIQPGASDPTL